MSEPPVLIDGVRVLRFCTFAAEMRPTGRRTIFVGDEQIDLAQVRALVIGENLANGDLVLMHCASSWEALACFFFEDVEAAEKHASAAYFGAPLRWEQYRPLNPVEAAEVEITRAELQAWNNECEKYGHREDES